MRDRINYLVAIAAVLLVVALVRAEPPRLFKVRNCMSGGCGQVASTEVATTKFRVTNRVHTQAAVVASAPAVTQATVTGDCAGGSCSLQQQTVRASSRFRLFVR